MIVLDMTILVYAHGRRHPLQPACSRLLRAIADGTIRATTTVEVIQEFAHHRARTRDSGDAVRLARYLARGLAPLLVVDEPDLHRGLDLFERHPALGSFDAVLCATALNRRVDALVSADRAFASVRGLKHVDPATPALDELIGRDAP